MTRRSLGPSASLLLTLLPAVLAFAWLVSKAQWFWSHQPDLQFGWIVLLLCGYLLWESWETRPAPQLKWSVPALLSLGLSCGLLFVIQIYQAACGTNPASMVALALALLWLILTNVSYVFGRRGVRHFAFSFCFLLVALPMPTLVHAILVGGLQAKIASLNVEVLNVLGIPARQSGSLIRLPNCVVGVDEACSGIRSLQSTVMATLFIGYLSLRRMGLRIVLALAGIGLAIVGNIIRSLFLSYTASTRGSEVLHQLHDPAGWSILLFTAVGIALLAWRLSRLENGVSGPPSPGSLPMEKLP